MGDKGNPGIVALGTLSWAADSQYDRSALEKTHLMVQGWEVVLLSQRGMPTCPGVQGNLVPSLRPQHLWQPMNLGLN